MNIMQTQARPWGSAVLPANLNTLILDLERARDFGLGNYGRYVELLATGNSGLPPSVVNGAQELLVGAQLEITGYILPTADVGTTIPPVVVALTASLLHQAIEEDRLSIQDGGSENIVEQTVGASQASAGYCFNVSGVCTPVAIQAWGRLRGFQGFDQITALYLNPNAQFGGDVPSILEDLRGILATIAFFNGSANTFPCPFASSNVFGSGLDLGLLCCFPLHISQTLASDVGNDYSDCGLCQGVTTTVGTY